MLQSENVLFCFVVLMATRSCVNVTNVCTVKTVLQQKSSRPPVPISNATKRSFMASPAGTGPADMQPSAQTGPEACSRYYLHPEEPDYL